MLEESVCSEVYLRFDGQEGATNVPKVPPKDAAPLPKVKNEEIEKWWTLGRGQKDSKKTKENEENKMSSKRKSSPMNLSLFQC
jgi:hypothetical protein